MNKHPQPPKSLLSFFRWFCHPDFVEDIEGDLMERFGSITEQLFPAKLAFSSKRETVLCGSDDLYRKNGLLFRKYFYCHEPSPEKSGVDQFHAEAANSYKISLLELSETKN